MHARPSSQQQQQAPCTYPGTGDLVRTTLANGLEDSIPEQLPQALQNQIGRRAANSRGNSNTTDAPLEEAPRTGTACPVHGGGEPDIPGSGCKQPSCQKLRIPIAGLSPAKPSRWATPSSPWLQENNARLHLPFLVLCCLHDPSLAFPPASTLPDPNYLRSDKERRGHTKRDRAHHSGLRVSFSLAEHSVTPSAPHGVLILFRLLSAAGSPAWGRSRNSD